MPTRQESFGSQSSAAFMPVPVRMSDLSWMAATFTCPPPPPGTGGDNWILFSSTLPHISVTPADTLSFSVRPKASVADEASDWSVALVACSRPVNVLGCSHSTPRPNGVSTPSPNAQRDPTRAAKYACGGKKFPVFIDSCTLNPG